MKLYRLPLLLLLCWPSSSMECFEGCLEGLTGSGRIARRPAVAAPPTRTVDLVTLGGDIVVTLTDDIIAADATVKGVKDYLTARGYGHLPQLMRGADIMADHERFWDLADDQVPVAFLPVHDLCELCADGPCVVDDNGRLTKDGTVLDDIPFLIRDCELRVANYNKDAYPDVPGWHYGICRIDHAGVYQSSRNRQYGEGRMQPRVTDSKTFSAPHGLGHGSDMKIMLDHGEWKNTSGERLPAGTTIRCTPTFERFVMMKDDPRNSEWTKFEYKSFKKYQFKPLEAAQNQELTQIIESARDPRKSGLPVQLRLQYSTVSGREVVATLHYGRIERPACMYMRPAYVGYWIHFEGAPETEQWPLVRYGRNFGDDQ